MNFFLLKRHTFFGLFFSLLFCACHSIESTFVTPASSHDYNTFYEWNELYLELDRYAQGFRPAPSSRALGYLGLSAYECSVHGMPKHLSIAPLYVGLDLPAVQANTDYHWAAAVNESYAYLLKRFFFPLEQENPVLFQKIDGMRNSIRTKFFAEAEEDVVLRSEKFGLDVARAIYDWEKTDEIGHDAFLVPSPSDYIPQQGPGKWQPTAPNFQKAMFPYWGQARAFAITNADKVALPPKAYEENETSVYWTQAMEVYTRVNNIRNNGPDAYQDEWVSQFWSDDFTDLTFSSPARLVAIANQVVESQRINHAECATLYAKLGIALADAGIATWRSKYLYNVQRPSDYIRNILSVQYPDAATWTSSMENALTGNSGLNPAFPAYPSEHSAFASAGAEILSSIFEHTNNYPGTYTFTDNCHLNRTEFIGTPRTFSSFHQMASENAYSRIPLGVNFRMDCEEGMRIGGVAAQRVLELPWEK